MKVKFLLYSFLLILLGSCSSPKTRVDLVLVNGHIVHLEDGKITNENVYINEGSIYGIGTEEDFPNMEANEEIDASDKYILPGFWDNHVHFRGGSNLIEDNRKFLNLFLANGITTVRDAGGDLGKEVLKWRDSINKKELLGPTIFTAGPKIDGPDPTWKGSLEVSNKADVLKALDSLTSLKTDFVKLYDSRISSENYLFAIEQASKRGWITSGHMPFSANFKEAVEAGLNASEHLYYVFKGCSNEEAEITQLFSNKTIGFREALNKIIASYDEEEATKTIDLIKKHHTFVVPTLHIMHTLSYLDEEDHQNDPYLKYFSSEFIKTYDRRLNAALGATDKSIKDRKELDSTFRRLNYRLYTSGVSLLAGSDCGASNSYIYPGVSLHKELAVLVSTGLSPLDALKTSAYNGAAFLKKEEEYGSLKKGKVSDIVLLNDNPLENIKNSQDIFMVIKGDKVLKKDDLNQLLAN